jgi:hypothetical protein
MDERVKINAEIKRKEAEYDREHDNRQELKRIEAAEGELADHLRRRGEAYVDAAGTTPSPATLEAWTVEFANAKEVRRRENNQRTIRHSEVF